MAPQSKLIERLNASDLDDESTTQFLLPIEVNRNLFRRRSRASYALLFQQATWYLEIFSASIIAFLLNLLDIIAYGRIVFPLIPSVIGRASVVPPNTMVMYTLTTVVAQLCFTTFSSMSHGVLAGTMVEIIPFYHAYFWTIYHSLTIEEPFITDFSSLYPTLFFMVLLSSATIAGVFYILGSSNLSKLIQFFPK